MPLEGLQLSFLPQVDCYELANPPVVELLRSSFCEQLTGSDCDETVLGGQLDFALAQMQQCGPESEFQQSIDLARDNPPIDPAAETLAISEVELEANDPLAPKFETKARGWIGWKETKRERKNRDPWICRQAWLYWEEPGGKKRSRYIPKAQLAAVQESVYELRRSIIETLELL
jgi:hypothetical protein